MCPVENRAFCMVELSFLNSLRSMLHQLESGRQFWVVGVWFLETTD
jgi:hypothetical protein